MDNFMKINVKETNKSWTSLKNPKIYGATGKARFDQLCCKYCPKLPRFKISFLALTHFLLNEQRAIVNKVIDINGKMCNATLGNHIETTWYTIFLNIIYLISVINKVIDNGKL